MASDDYGNDDTDNNSAGTATNLGLLSRYKSGGSVNFIEFNKVSWTRDPDDFFSITHPKGLDEITITLTMPSPPGGDASQILRLVPYSGFESTKAKELHFFSGAYEGSHSHLSSGRDFYHTTTKSFTFDLTNSSKAKFYIQGGITEGLPGTYPDLEYTLQVHVKKEFDTRNKIVGTKDNDNLSGKGGDDVIIGRGGKDNLKGEGGGDDLRGGGSKDKLFGQGGNDELRGGGGNDKHYGGGGKDTIVGGGGNDALYGGTGNDELLGEGGKDKLDGGTGNDTLIGGDTLDRDTFVFNENWGNDAVIGWADGVDVIDFSSNSEVNSLADLDIDQVWVLKDGALEPHTHITQVSNPNNVIRVADAVSAFFGTADFDFL